MHHVRVRAGQEDRGPAAGTFGMNTALNSGSSSSGFIMSVMVAVGPIALTLTPCFAHSIARHFVSWSTPPFVAQ